MTPSWPEFTVFIRWGSTGQTVPIRYDFDSELELDAFLKGVDEASGWMDYTVVDNDGNEI